jgi:type I restriction enzyme S subunit
MIEGLQPYSEYKESGLPWLGRCPSHWNLRRTKILFHERVQKGFPNEPLLAATQTKGVVRKEDYETRTVTAQKDLHLLKLVETGDYVISLRSFQGGLEYAHQRGIISPAYTILEPGKSAKSGFYTHFFKAKPFVNSLSLFVTGIREGQNVDYERLSRAEIPLPPEDEQAVIVRFLDHANRKIDRFIQAKRKLIGLLNEQKQAIIHRAVTRGLNPNAPLKPSGITWLGDIPQHWEIAALRRHWRVTDCKHLTVPFVEDGIPLASVVEVQSFSLNLSRCKKTTPFWYRMLIDGGRKPKRNDLIYCRNASVGACALVETDIDFAMGQDVCLIRSTQQNQRFLNYLLHSPFMDQQLELLLVGSTFKRINVADIKALTVLIPPRDEQDAICSHLDSELRVYDTAIARTEREIALLQEYRTRLTADVVTGKLDVRAAVSKLPAISDEKEVELDETDETEDLSEES